MVKLPSARKRVEVRGESNYQDALKRVAKRYQDHSSANITATLLREPTNKHDRNAVMVRLDGRTVGYLAREDAIRYQPLLQELEQRGHIAEADAQLTGGVGNAKSFGLNLYIAEPDKAASVLTGLPEPALTQVEPEQKKRGLLSRLRGQG